MTGVTLPFSCKCGTVHGTLDDITPSAGTQLQCQCDDCRRAVIWLGQPDPGIDGMRHVVTRHFSTHSIRPNGPSRASTPPPSKIRARWATSKPALLSRRTTANVAMKRWACSSGVLPNASLARACPDHGAKRPFSTPLVIPSRQFRR